MKEQVTKIAQMLNSVLNQQGFSTKSKAILQILEDFESSTVGEMERDFDNNNFDDLDDLSRNLHVYVDLKNLINKNSNNKIELQNGLAKIISVYDYYEQKYIRELEFQNSEQRRNFIETILSPLILISLFFEDDLIKNSTHKIVMLRASIFQKNILSKTSKSDFAESFQNCLVEIDETKLIIYKEDELILKTDLELSEVDFHTTTYLGKYNDNVPFRVIRPNDVVLQGFKNQHNCISAFSIGSVNPEDYAIHFILTESNDIRNINFHEKGNDEQIQRLLEGCVMALENELHQNFVDYSKRLLKLINSYREIEDFKFGNEVLQLMRRNGELYTWEEKVKIYD